MLCVLHGLSTLTDGNMNCSHSFMNSRNCPVYCFAMILSFAWSTFLSSTDRSIHKYRGHLWSLLTLALGILHPLVVCLTNSMYCGFPECQPVSSQLNEILHSLCISSSFIVDWRLTLDSKLQKSYILPHWFSSLRDHRPLLHVSSVWNILYGFQVV